VTVRGRIGLLLCLLLAATTARTAERVTKFVFPRLNDTFRNLAPDIMPVSAAGLTINLRSPSNSLTVRGHSLELEPLGAGRYRFHGWVDFLGEADLVAQFAASVPGEIEDKVLLPSQVVELEGEVDLVKMPGGYDLTTRRMPAAMDLQMQSRLGGQVVKLCDMLSLFSGGDCSGLGASFGRVRVPLPPPGDTYFIADEELTSEERQLIDAYLKVAPAP
jgi:hypothetical protein